MKKLFLKRKHVPTYYVLKAYEILQDERGKNNSYVFFPYQYLSIWTGACDNVCYRAMERDYDNGYIDYGVSLRSGWLTNKGKELIRKGYNND